MTYLNAIFFARPGNQTSELLNARLDMLILNIVFSVFDIDVLMHTRKHLQTCVLCILVTNIMQYSIHTGNK